jgi:hypothetical protein
MAYFLRILFFFILGHSLHGQIIEKTHLTTDRSIYVPEDTVWFKAYIFDRTNVPSNQSIALKLFMVSTAGEKLLDRSIPIIDGTASGFFLAPKAEGKFSIIAISGQMLGSETDQAFTKDIFVREALVDEFSIRAFQRTIPQQAGEGFTVDVYATSANGEKTLPKTNFSYELWSDTRRVDRGRERTDENGKATITVDKLDWGKGLLLSISSNEGSGDRAIEYTLPIVAERPKIDLRFFPEGGEMILGLANKVAFKATTPNGSGFDFKGLLVDSEGNFVDSISSYYQGMGSFMLNPAKEYAVKVIGLPDTAYALPKAKPDGITLSLSRKEGVGHVLKVLASAALMGSSVNIELSQFDLISSKQRVTLQARQFFELPTDFLSAGVAKITVYSDQGVPLAERLVFAGAKPDVKFKIVTDQTSYAPRQKTKVDIFVNDSFGTPVAASFNIAVTDKDRTFGPVDSQPNLMANILLSSELRGNVPTPNFYFTDDPKAVNALDLVMLSHGWRKFVPSQLADPEGISGTVLNNNNKRKLAVDKPITLTAFNGYPPLDIATNEEGFFEVPSFYLKDKGDSFLLTAPTESRKDRFSIMLDESNLKAGTALFKNKAELFANQHPFGSAELFLQTYKLPEDRFNSILMLNTVVVNANRQRNSDCELMDYHFEKPWVTKTADQLDMTNGEIMDWIQQVSTRVKGYGDINIVARGFRGILGEDALLSTFKPNVLDVPFQVYINCDLIPIIKNGGPFPPDFQIRKTFEAIDFSNVESISVRENYPNTELPIIRINTIDNKLIYKPTFRKYRFLTLYTAYKREFYSPVYDTPEKAQSPVPDLRETIFWQATVHTDDQGKATLEFYNADRPNNMLINIEGVDIYGRIGVSNLTYKVN